jgi:hypothetical protein
MKNVVIFTVLICLTVKSFGQVKITALDKAAIPKSIKYTGHIINSVTYSDKDGEHLVITTESGTIPSKGPDSDNFRNEELHAYHYKKTAGELKLTWQTYDFIKDCDVDLAAHYLPNTFAITDLDNNGIAEVWLMYKTVCHGDVSPSDLQIIMHEGDKKYAVRGTTKVILPGEKETAQKETYGGKYTFDAVFKDGPKSFRDYASALWKNNMIEDWK